MSDGKHIRSDQNFVLEIVDNWRGDAITINCHHDKTAAATATDAASAAAAAAAATTTTTTTTTTTATILYGKKRISKKLGHPVFLTFLLLCLRPGKALGGSNQMKSRLRAHSRCSR